MQKRKAIGEEVARLLVAEFIREIYHSKWLANVVMVPKKDDSHRMCIDFKHINRACPKDHFPLPCIDQIVDSKVKPVKEHLRWSAVHKRKAIGEEVARLLAVEFIREIYHSEWLANVVMVPKKDDSLPMCIDFKHINRACPKDHFPLLASTKLSTRLRGVSVCPFWTPIPCTIRSDCMDPMR